MDYASCIVSTAELGTITIVEFSFKPSYSVFMTLRCNAIWIVGIGLGRSPNFSATRHFISIAFSQRLDRVIASERSPFDLD